MLQRVEKIVRRGCSSASCKATERLQLWKRLPQATSRKLIIHTVKYGTVHWMGAVGVGASWRSYVDPVYDGRTKTIACSEEAP